MIEIVLLEEDDSQLERFWRLRLRALQDAPEAFASSYEESAQSPLHVLVEEQRARMSSESVVFIAQENNEFVGMTGLHRYTRLKTKHTAQIWGVYVLPEMRGRQVAQALMQRAIDYARALPGLEVLQLSVSTRNTPALRLYQSLGFVTWGTQPGALYVNDSYVDAHHMILEL